MMVAVLLLALAPAVPAMLQAQVRIGVTAGTFVYDGATAAVDANDPATARPHGSYAWGGAMSWQRGAWLVRLGVVRSEPGVIVGDDVTQIVDRSILGLLVVEPALARRLLTASEGGIFWLEAGPSLHRWSPIAAEARTKVGGTAALVWRQRAMRRVDLSVRAHASASASPFTQQDLPIEMRPATLWRTGVTLEVSWRL